ncbi:sn-glycerol-3-phosphate import ATP-binding protein UgpC [Bordetella tumbae]|uniref:ABC transporter ATP-binding protein n=1 Tax=Bordetella tumbae TaxID=1649139 RepID=UPI0039F0A932
MQLTLDQVALQEGAQTHLYPMSLAPIPGAMTVLLGVTLAGKTSLMRLMAGLDRPTSGRVLVDGVDVTGVPVRRRNVAMVYQQFINYPSMSVYDNIASPLKLRGATDIRARVHAMAERLHIEHLLQRYPAELSGGQQQRVALARALAKQAPLILLDEPLVNLDYKLREELRDELGSLFAEGESTVVYATTEPAEALLLGGYTAVMDAGELLQYGPAAEVFHQPASLRVAQVFSDPPMNLFAAQRQDGGIVLQGGIAAGRVPESRGQAALAAGAPADAGPDAREFVPGLHAGAGRSAPAAQPHAGTGQSEMTAGLRAGAFSVEPAAGRVALQGTVKLAEISGSDTYVHAETAAGPVVAQLAGVHRYQLEDPLTLYFDPASLYTFDAAGRLLAAGNPAGVA